MVRCGSGPIATHWIASELRCGAWKFGVESTRFFVCLPAWCLMICGNVWRRYCLSVRRGGIGIPADRLRMTVLRCGASFTCVQGCELAGSVERVRRWPTPVCSHSAGAGNVHVRLQAASSPERSLGRNRADLQRYECHGQVMEGLWRAARSSNDPRCWSRGARECGTVVEQEGKVQRGRPRRSGDADAHRQR